jgi:integrase
VEGYRFRLLELGYTPGTVRGMLKVLGHLGRWMASEGLEAGQVDGGMVEGFLAARGAEGCRWVPTTARGLVSLFDYLRDEGIIVREHSERPLTPLETLIADYREWLVVERGLAEATVRRYEWLAGRFLGERSSPGDSLGVKSLTGADVSAFLVSEFARLSVGAAKGRVAELRSLLRFLHLRGLTVLALADAVPSVAGWHDVGIPVTIAASDVERLLSSCVGSERLAVRNFAILMLLARLGLRSVEVARLELDDLDWRAGEIVVRGKARRQDRLPLPCDVGDALAAYLALDGRRKARRVFLTLRAPRRPIRAEVVGDVVRRECTRAGLPQVGAHRLRHSLATELLGHREPRYTYHYLSAAPELLGHAARLLEHTQAVGS